MSANKIHLRVVTPKRILLDKEVDMVILRGSEGDIGVLKGHQPLTIMLDYGMMRVTEDDKEMVSSVLGGFAEITPDKVTVLTDAAEWPDEIDLQRAEEAKERARNRLEKKDEADLMRAELALRRALARIEVRGYNK